MKMLRKIMQCVMLMHNLTELCTTAIQVKILVDAAKAVFIPDIGTARK